MKFDRKFLENNSSIMKLDLFAKYGLYHLASRNWENVKQKRDNLLNDKNAHKNYKHFRDTIRLNLTDGFKKFLSHKDNENIRLIDYYNNWSLDWIEAIHKNDIGALKLNYEDYAADKKGYISKIINYLKL